jgi:hypothetical protein
MRINGFLLVAVAAPVLAQTTVAPTNERVGEARGQTIGNYSLLQSWEVGYRMKSVGGNDGKYRSDVNFGNGLRLLSSRLSLNSRDGHGHYFDELMVSTQGLGNDPYESATLRIAKNRMYRYDMLWRSNEYYNPALPVSAGQHLADTTRRIQDHDITLFPQSKVRFFAGFSRVTQQGAAFLTENQFDVRGDEFPLFGNVHRRQNEFRVGNELRLFGVKLNWMQVWEQYREDSPSLLESPSAGNNQADRTRLTSLVRQEPWEGTTPSFRLNLFRERGEHWAVNGRFAWSGGRRNFSFDESTIGVDRFGGAMNRQIAVGGNVRRPVTSANVTFSLFPTSEITITNHTAFHSTRMEGDTNYRELNNSDLTLASVQFQYLGIRNITNATDAFYQIKPWIALRGGFQHSDRKIRSVEQTTIEGFAGTIAGEQSNELNSGIAGIRLKPVKPLTIALDGELGRQSQPFYATSEKDYHAVSGRAQYRRGPLTMSAIVRSYSNFNTTSLFAHSAKTRQYSYDGAWTPRDWMTIEGGYSRIHADTITGIAYFLNSSLVSGDRSLWISNLHTGHLGGHFSFRDRFDIYLGLSITRDAGDDRARGGSNQSAFQQAQVFPMSYDAPLARFSVKIHPKVRWNTGYQYYRYREDILPIQNYRAHTGYTSVLWTF